MSTAVLHALERRDKPARTRKEGFIPGIVYGEGLHGSISVKFDAYELNRELREKGKDLKMAVELGGRKKEAIIKEIQRDTLTSEVRHIDLQVIRENEKVKVALPVEVTGREEIEKKGLLVEVFSKEIEVTGPLNILPKSVILDVGSFSAGDSIKVGELHLDPGISVHNSPDETMVIVSHPKVTAAPAEAENNDDTGQI